MKYYATLHPSEMEVLIKFYNENKGKYSESAYLLTFDSGSGIGSSTHVSLYHNKDVSEDITDYGSW